MYKSRKIIRHARCLGAVLFIIAVLSTASFVYAEPPAGIQEKLEAITQEEKKILRELFALSQEIEVLEQEEKQLALDIEVLMKEIKAVDRAIEIEEENYYKQQTALKLVLRSYQKMGPGSYLEIMMDSDSLTVFVRRINTLRDIARNTAMLLDQVKDSKNRLALEKEKRAKKLQQQEEKQQQSKAALESKQKLKQEQEAFLLSLKEEGEFYQEQLDNIQAMLKQVKPILSDAAQSYTETLQKDGLPEDALKISFSFFSIKGVLWDKSFNDVVSSNPQLPRLSFAFHENKMDIGLPEYQLVLSGAFELENGNSLRFHAEEGSFWGMPLESKYVREIFADGEMVLDLKPLLKSNTLTDIKLREGHIELYIRPGL